MSLAIVDVVAERWRQVEVEGWTTEHDDRNHNPGDLSRAAACYAVAGSLSGPGARKKLAFDSSDLITVNLVRRLWPFLWEWWKPTNRRRDLVKAGALILAEIERIDRETERG